MCPSPRLANRRKAAGELRWQKLSGFDLAQTHWLITYSKDERLRKEFPLITLPVLILHGTDDKNTKPDGSQHFHDMAGSVDKTLKLYEGGFHDLLNDLDKRVVMQDIQGWIGARLPATLRRTA